MSIITIGYADEGRIVTYRTYHYKGARPYVRVEHGPSLAEARERGKRDRDAGIPFNPFQLLSPRHSAEWECGFYASVRETLR